MYFLDKQLTKRLGTSPAYITKILRGDINFTVDSMVRLAKAAGGKVQIHVGPEEIRWFGVAQKKKAELPKKNIRLTTPKDPGASFLKRSQNRTN